MNDRNRARLIRIFRVIALVLAAAMVLGIVFQNYLY